ncbi:MAG TPA: hypothetical protein VFW83_01685, partial [Bryobacteraceae bacterium]|nr:hypothetical protein [Bryobacteraceae bacterium]
MRFFSTALLLSCTGLLHASPPLICPAGGPIGSIDLRISPSSGHGGAPLPLRTINRLDEGETILYRPILRSGEERKGEISVVLVPAKGVAAHRKLLIFDPKPAGKPQQWTVPWRASVVAYVYGPSGLNIRKVKRFLAKDDELVAELADYAQKTEQTEALIAALSSPTSTDEVVQSTLQGFSSQYGVNSRLDRSVPVDQQALALLRTLNPTVASYDPISPDSSQQFRETAGLAASIASLFFGNPVGLAAGSTAMLLDLRALAFPDSQFRSSFSEPIANDGLGLCGKQGPAPPHTRVVYLWASRVPNARPPQISIGTANSLPRGVKSPLPVHATDSEWKILDRARNWTLRPAAGPPIPIHAQMLAADKALELDLADSVRPGIYSLEADWDWDRFVAQGHVQVQALGGFESAHPDPSSQDLLTVNTGKVPVTLHGGDFEFVKKVEIEKVNDEFASPAAVPFVLPRGLRQGPQPKMDVQIDTGDLAPGKYNLLISQVDGKKHPVAIEILPAPPVIGNLPATVNQGTTDVQFALKGQRLGLMKRVEIGGQEAALNPPSNDGTQRTMKVRLARNLARGTTLAAKIYVEDRTRPLLLPKAIQIVGPRPVIAKLTVARLSGLDVQLEAGELPGGALLSAMMQARELLPDSEVKLDCAQDSGPAVTLRMGERSGALNLQQVAPGEAFLSFDSSAWFNGCMLQARVVDETEGVSDPYPLGRVVRLPKIEDF